MRSTTMAENNLSPTWMKMAVLFSFLAYAHGDEGMCLWYGNCGPNPISPTNECLNCYAGKSGKPPKPLLDADSKTQLFEACPHFREEYGEDPKVCCTPRQIKDMNKKFGIARQLLNSCPTCFLNFRKNFCASTCSPVQKNFLKVSENNIIKRKKEPCGDRDTIDTGMLLAMIQAIFERCF